MVICIILYSEPKDVIGENPMEVVSFDADLRPMEKGIERESPDLENGAHEEVKNDSNEQDHKEVYICYGRNRGEM